MKMTMQTPGRSITVELPTWLERRILSLFYQKAKKPISNKERN